MHPATPAPTQSAKTHPAALAVGAGALFLLLWAGLRLVLLNPQFSFPLQLSLLLASAILCLCMGLSLLWLAFRRPAADLPLALALALALLVPLPAWVLFSSSPEAPFSFLDPAGNNPALPYIFIWQSLVLAVLAVFTRPRLLEDLRSCHWQTAVTASISALGLWLAAVFIYSLLAAGLLLPASTPTAYPPVLMITSLCITPWASENLFRRQLLERWQQKPGPLAAVLISSVLFAIFQLRPILWAPAFIAGLGFTILARSTRSLWPAVLAHTLFNALALFSGWGFWI